MVSDIIGFDYTVDQSITQSNDHTVQGSRAANTAANSADLSGFSSAVGSTVHQKMSAMMIQEASRWALSFGQYDDGPTNLYNMSFT